jgi:2,3-bisphosphoglycerate-independent phosphoglycerate mutase
MANKSPVDRSALVLFLDGVGLGDHRAESNPFMHANLPTLQSLLEVPLLTRDVAGTVTKWAALLGLDACLGVPGLPQSGTGQTTILTGNNAPAVLGEHYGPYPNKPLRQMLVEDNIFKTVLDAGQSAAYANAYPTRFIDRLNRGKGRLSANTQAAYLSGLKIRSGEDLQQGRAISALLSNEYWPEPDVKLPPVDSRQAGRNFARLGQEHALTFFEFWYSDILGHKQKRDESIRILSMLDDFVAGILDELDLSRSLLLVVSDHGNFEDWTTSKHTTNPALTILIGAGFEKLVPQLQSLLDVKQALLSFL